MLDEEHCTRSPTLRDPAPRDQDPRDLDSRDLHSRDPTPRPVLPPPGEVHPTDIQARMRELALHLRGLGQLAGYLAGRLDHSWPPVPAQPYSGQGQAAEPGVVSRRCPAGQLAAHLAGVLRVVRSDLLEDAVTTLLVTASLQAQDLAEEGFAPSDREQLLLPPGLASL